MNGHVFVYINSKACGQVQHMYIPKQACNLSYINQIMLSSE